jgi:hypothetical protein
MQRLKALRDAPLALNQQKCICNLLNMLMS